MTAIAFQSWTEPRAGAEARPRLKAWIVGSVAFHAVLIALLLLSPDWRPMHLSDRAADDRPAVEVVMTRLVKTATPTPSDEDIATDRPSDALPPPVRKLDTQSDLEARPDSPLAAGVQPIDPRAIREYVKRHAPEAAIDQSGLGYSWATCSMLSPERRVLEPACDGLLMKQMPGETGIAALMAPDAATLRAIKAYAPKAEPPPNPEGDAKNDRAFRNESDDYYGPRPWE